MYEIKGDRATTYSHQLYSYIHLWKGGRIPQELRDLLLLDLLVPIRHRLSVTSVLRYRQYRTCQYRTVQYGTVQYGTVKYRKSDHIPNSHHWPYCTISRSDFFSNFWPKKLWKNPDLDDFKRFFRYIRKFGKLRFWKNVRLAALHSICNIFSESIEVSILT